MPGHDPSPLFRLEAVLKEQQYALASGDLQTLGEVNARLLSLLENCRHLEPGAVQDPEVFANLTRQFAGNVALAYRGLGAVERALTVLGGHPLSYNRAGAIARTPGQSRRQSA